MKNAKTKCSLLAIVMLLISTVTIAQVRSGENAVERNLRETDKPRAEKPADKPKADKPDPRCKPNDSKPSRMEHTKPCPKG